MITGNEPMQPVVFNGLVYGDGSSESPSIERGLTIRQHFAAIAPNEIPIFFRHIEAEKNISPMPVWYDIENKEDAALCRDWLSDGVFDLPEHLSWFAEAFKKHQIESDEWHRKNRQEIFFQWRTFYADALIAELNKKEKK